MNEEAFVRMLKASIEETNHKGSEFIHLIVLTIFLEEEWHRMKGIPYPMEDQINKLLKKVTDGIHEEMEQIREVKKVIDNTIGKKVNPLDSILNNTENNKGVWN